MKMAEPGPVPATAGTDNDQLNRQFPKYYVVKGHVCEMLERLAPGEPLLPERTLAARFSTSRTTIRQALRELTIEGRLLRMQGRGTFAAVPKMAQPLQLTSYTEDMRRRGLASRSKLLAVGNVPADDELAWRLDVRERAPRPAHRTAPHGQRRADGDRDDPPRCRSVPRPRPPAG